MSDNDACRTALTTQGLLIVKEYQFIYTRQNIVIMKEKKKIFSLCTLASSLNRPHWADSVIEVPCPDVCVCVCVFAPSGADFF